MPLRARALASFQGPCTGASIHSLANGSLGDFRSFFSAEPMSQIPSHRDSVVIPSHCTSLPGHASHCTTTVALHIAIVALHIAIVALHIVIVALHIVTSCDLQGHRRILLLYVYSMHGHTEFEDTGAISTVYLIIYSVQCHVNLTQVHVTKNMLFPPLHFIVMHMHASLKGNYSLSFLWGRVYSLSTIINWSSRFIDIAKFI